MSVYKLGLLGLGTVGAGVARLLASHQEDYARLTGKRLEVESAAVRNLSKPRGDLPASVRLTTDPLSIVESPSTQLVVELLGGVEEPFRLIRRALELGKSVVTANKALLAERGGELFQLAKQKGGSIAFEAAVAGGIPIIATLSQSLRSNRIESLEAILNGTSNFILTQMEQRGCSYQSALQEAQALGFAEADPTLDVDGSDATQKLAILVQLAFGTAVPWKQVVRQGIDNIQSVDQTFAQELGYRIKLLAVARQKPAGLEVHVTPTLVKRGTPLAEVSGAYNAVSVRGDAVGDLFLQGKGAGQGPTASAVVADILDTVLGRAALTFRTLSWTEQNHSLLPLAPEERFEGRYYLRFTVLDQPGVLAEIAGALGQQGISIASVIQHDTTTEGSAQPTAPLVIMTHATQRGPLSQALARIQQIASVRGPCVHLRICD